MSLMWLGLESTIKGAEGTQVGGDGVETVKNILMFQVVIESERVRDVESMDTVSRWASNSDIFMS